MLSLAALIFMGGPCSAFADLDAGLAALRRQDFKTSFKEFEVAAKAGNPVAQKGLGWLFDEGNGTTKSYARALVWFRKAAAQGDSEAMESIGNHYAYGLGVTQDIPTAVEWLAKATEAGSYAYPQNIPGVSDNPAIKKRFDDGVAATLEAYRRKAEQDDTVAQVRLGYMYMVDLSTTPQSMTENQLQAAGWIRKAAEKGHAGAQGMLGLMYAIELVGERDQVLAAKWYQLAANQGNANAQYKLAVIYAGAGGMKYSAAKSVPKDIDKAKEWATKAAQHGVAKAQTLLGALLLKTGTSEKAYAESFSWLRKAATQADPEAQVFIGDIYVSGTGVPKDYPQAITFYRKAIDTSGSKFAYGRLARMYEEGLGVPKDNTEALQLYEKASESTYSVSDAPLHIKLARMYEDGVGTPKDGGKAFQHYGSAALAGDADAMKRLKEVFEKGLLGQKADPEKAKYWNEQIGKGDGPK